jgi:hypothetical protein
MATLRQIQANRRNALRSTGPKTPQGKAVVRLNALTHGMCAADAVLPGEDEQDLHQLAKAFQAAMLPAGPAEQSLVYQMVLACWKLRRHDRVETAGYLSQGPEALIRLARFFSRDQRCFYRAFDRLQSLRSARALPATLE